MASSPTASATIWPHSVTHGAEDPIYVHFNVRNVLRSREPEQFPSWLDDDLQLFPVGTVICAELGPQGTASQL